MSLIFPAVLMHWVHAKRRSPEAERNHCRFGYFRFRGVGLYALRTLTRWERITEPLPQREHFLMEVATAHRVVLNNGRSILHDTK